MNRSRFYDALAWGVILFGFTLPLSKSAGNVLLFLLYPVAAAGVLFYQDIRSSILSHVRQPLTLSFLLLFAISFIGVFFSEKFGDGMQTANKFLSLPAIYWMIAVLSESVLDDSKKFRNGESVLMAFLCGLMALNIIGLMTYLGIVGNRKFALPLSPLHVHHIWFSNINAIGVYAAASFLLYSRERSARVSVFLYAFLALAAVCIILSTSRTAWLGILATSLIMTFIVSRRKKTFVITAVSLAAACIAVYLFVPFVRDRIQMIGHDITHYSAGDSVTSLGARFLMWKAAFLMFLSNPLIGVGTGDYVPTMAAYVRSGQFPAWLLDFNQPHNMYLFSLATNGLPGLAALLFVFYRALTVTVPALRAPEKEVGGNRERVFTFLAAATTVHFLIAGLTDSFFNIQILRYAFAFVMGLCIRTAVVKQRT